MNRDTRKKLDALRLCVFRPGSWDKRFVRDLAALGDYDLLSAAQEACVEALYWRYRRQVNAVRESNPAAYPQPVKPDVTPLMHPDETGHDAVRQSVARVNKKAVAAIDKLNQWNRKVKGDKHD